MIDALQLAPLLVNLRWQRNLSRTVAHLKKLCGRQMVQTKNIWKQVQMFVIVKKLGQTAEKRYVER